MKRKGLATILLSVTSMLVVLLTVAHAEERKYPPYPDVWGIELPVSESVDYAALRVVKMPDGDFMVTYVIDWIYLKNRKAKDFNLEKDVVGRYKGNLIFSMTSKSFRNDDEYNKFFEKMREEDRLLERSADFSDGSGISEGCGDIGARTEVCNPLSGCYAMTDKDGNVLLRKKILYVYSKPVRKEVDLTCEGTENYSGEFYNERVHFLEEMTYHTLERIYYF